MRLKTLGLAILAMALTGLTAGTASAATVAIGKVTQTTSVTLTFSLKPGSSVTIRTTGGLFANTCTKAHKHGATVAPFSAKRIKYTISEYWYGMCTEEPVKVDAAGSLGVEHTSGANGTVSSEGAEMTVPSPFGTLTCKTGAGTDIGTLTGVESGNATLDMNGVVNCGIIPSAVWEATWFITSPQGFGIHP